MKIAKKDLKKLMMRDVYLLDPDELSAILYLINLRISKYNRTHNSVKFRIEGKQSVWVRCDIGSNVSIGRKLNGKGVEGMISWGGVYSLRDIINTYFFFFAKMEMSFGDSKKRYSPKEYGIIASEMVKIIFEKEEKTDAQKCRECGCTENSACHDPETGSCWWVFQDLCSACATQEQKQQALKEMKKLSK